MKKRLLAMGLALLLVLTMVPTVWATSPGDDTVTDGKTPEITESETRIRPASRRAAMRVRARFSERKVFLPTSSTAQKCSMRV